MLNHSLVVYFPFRLCLSDPTTKCVDNIRVVSLGHSFSCWRYLLNFEIPIRNVLFRTELSFFAEQKQLTYAQQFISHDVFTEGTICGSSTCKPPIEIVAEDVPVYGTNASV